MSPAQATVLLMETSPQPSLDFTAIDFETANPSRASACAVGLAKVREGAVIDTATWLIAPPEGLDDFAPRHVAIHGITPESVRDAPAWDRVFPEVMGFIGGDDLLAHNAPFDRSVLQQVCAVFDIDAPAAAWYDTLPIARRLLTLGSYSLPFVARALNLDDLTHHEAQADAIHAARIAVALSGRAGAANLGARSLHLDRLTHPEAPADAIQAARIAIALSGRAGAGNLRDLSLPLGRASSVSPSSSISASGDGSRPEGDFSSLTATDVLAGH